MDTAASANLDDLQRSWETLKNVVNIHRCISHYKIQITSSYVGYHIYFSQISEKQKSLYEALERQQHYQETLQSVSTKMESIETALNEGLEPSKSPESQMAAHQVRETEDQMKQDDHTKARSHKNYKPEDRVTL